MTTIMMTVIFGFVQMNLRQCLLLLTEPNAVHYFHHYHNYLPLAAAEGEEDYDYYSNCCFTNFANSAIGIGLRAKHFTVTLGFSFKNSSY